MFLLDSLFILEEMQENVLLQFNAIFTYLGRIQAQTQAFWSLSKVVSGLKDRLWMIFLEYSMMGLNHENIYPDERLINFKILKDSLIGTGDSLVLNVSVTLPALGNEFISHSIAVNSSRTILWYSTGTLNEIFMSRDVVQACKYSKLFHLIKK